MSARSRGPQEAEAKRRSRPALLPGWPLDRKETRLSEQRTYRRWTATQKLEIVLAGLKGDHSVRDVCREQGISETLYTATPRARPSSRAGLEAEGAARVAPSSRPSSRRERRSPPTSTVTTDDRTPASGIERRPTCAGRGKMVSDYRKQRPEVSSARGSRSRVPIPARCGAACQMPLAKRLQRGRAPGLLKRVASP